MEKGVLTSKAKDEKGIREKIHDIRLHPDNCELIRSFVLENGGVEYAEEKQMGYVEEAIQALSVFPDCREKEVLEFIARHNAVRTK